jgi:hypothetical protein
MPAPRAALHLCHQPPADAAALNVRCHEYGVNHSSVQTGGSDDLLSRGGDEDPSLAHHFQHGGGPEDLHEPLDDLARVILGVAFANCRYNHLAYSFGVPIPRRA